MKRMRSKPLWSFSLISLLFIFQACEGEKASEELLPPPLSKFTTAFPKKFLNPERELGSPFVIISGNDTTSYYFSFDKTTRSSVVKIINRSDTTILTDMYLNKRHDLYFWNHPVEDSLWEISAFSVGDTSANSFTSAVSFLQLYKVDEIIETTPFKEMIKEKSSSEIVITGNKKELYRLFSAVIDNSGTLEKIPESGKQIKETESDYINEDSKDTISASAVTIFPNPATDKVTVAGIKKGYYIALRNSNEETLAVKVAQSSEETLNFPLVKAGLYFLLLVDPATQKKTYYQLIIR